MGRKYGFIIIVAVFILFGLLFNFINRYYSLSYLYNHYLKREFSINPRAQIIPDKKYTIRIWYPPFYRTIKDKDEKSFFKLLQERIRVEYPNIKLKVACIDFRRGEEELSRALQEGRPPDIYLNLAGDYNFKDKYSIQVDPFLEKEEKKGFELFLDEGVLNNLPFLVHNPGIITANIIKSGRDSSYLDNFTEFIETYGRGKLLFNTADQNLLKFFLSSKGINKFAVKEGKISGDVYNKLKDIYEWFHSLRVKEYFAVSPVMMDDFFLKSFYEGKAEMIGPVNFYLEQHLLQENNNLKKVRLDNYLRVYYLNIFRQKEYKGDDHTKAVMETARIMAEVCGEKLAEEMGLRAAYNYEDKKTIQKFIIYSGQDYDYWETIILKGWNDFWEKGLHPEEVMNYYE